MQNIILEIKIIQIIIQDKIKIKKNQNIILQVKIKEIVELKIYDFMILYYIYFFIKLYSNHCSPPGVTLIGVI